MDNTIYCAFSWGPGLGQLLFLRWAVLLSVIFTAECMSAFEWKNIVFCSLQAKGRLKQ